MLCDKENRSNRSKAENNPDDVRSSQFNHENAHTQPRTLRDLVDCHDDS
jgi:hypothetical protein